MSRTATVLLAGTLLVAAAGSTASAGERNGGGNGKARSSSSANSGCGEYCSTRDGSPSRNGNGNGKATGRPCAGCVGKADDKNPKGQRPNGSDSNNGYECDGNSGIARSNPAHTGCTPPVTRADAEPATGPAAAPAPATVVPPVAKTGGTLVSGASSRKLEVLPAGVAMPVEVLGTRFERPAASPYRAGSRGSLPYTGGMTGELLLAGLASVLAGVVMTRRGAKRA